MPIVRSIAGILAGLVVIFLLVGIIDLVGSMLFHAMPDGQTGEASADANMIGYSLWNIAGAFLAALPGAWLAGLIAGRRPLMHAAVIAGVIGGLGIVNVFFGRAAYEAVGIMIPTWYLPMLPVAGAVGALTGGWLRKRRQPGGT